MITFVITYRDGRQIKIKAFDIFDAARQVEDEEGVISITESLT